MPEPHTIDAGRLMPDTLMPITLMPVTIHAHEALLMPVTFDARHFLGQGSTFDASHYSCPSLLMSVTIDAHCC